jgi:hypothetical protein
MHDPEEDNSGELDEHLQEDEQRAENALDISSGEWLTRAKAVNLSPSDILKLLASGIDTFISEVETRERQNPSPSQLKPDQGK